MDNHRGVEFAGPPSPWKTANIVPYHNHRRVAELLQAPAAYDAHCRAGSPGGVR